MTKPLQASTFLVLALAAVAMSGCGGGPSFVMRNEFIGFTPEQRVEMENRSTTPTASRKATCCRCALPTRRN
jgi:hypothetical protein